MKRRDIKGWWNKDRTMVKGVEGELKKSRTFLFLILLLGLSLLTALFLTADIFCSCLHMFALSSRLEEQRDSHRRQQPVNEQPVLGSQQQVQLLLTSWPHSSAWTSSAAILPATTHPSLLFPLLLITQWSFFWNLNRNQRFKCSGWSQRDIAPSTSNFRSVQAR